ncbi:unnamed protein product [Trichobilharzia regenti]|nr:unnamed protein product [Trichobilharzia regenti]
MSGDLIQASNEYGETSAGFQRTVSAQDGKKTCAESSSSGTYHNSISSFRRFLIFKCLLTLLGLFSFVVIRHRQKRLDRKLIQRVNLQIATGV